jgi:hypothetical protein
MTEFSETIQSCIGYELLASLRAKTVAWLRSCMTARVGSRESGECTAGYPPIISVRMIAYTYDLDSYRMNGSLKPEL